MANHVSALKRARQTETRTEVNRSNRSRVRSSLRALREALAKGDVKAAQAQYRATVSSLDKSVQKGVLHSNTVSRYKSRLNARLKTLATTGAPRQDQEEVVFERRLDGAEVEQPGAIPAVAVFGVQARSRTFAQQWLEHRKQRIGDDRRALRGGMDAIVLNGSGHVHQVHVEHGHKRHVMPRGQVAKHLVE